MNGLGFARARGRSGPTVPPERESGWGRRVKDECGCVPIVLHVQKQAPRAVVCLHLVWILHQ